MQVDKPAMTIGAGKKMELPVLRPAGGSLSATEIVAFRRKLMQWYQEYARKLPWRGINDPYRTWVSEIMLQQTRVAAVLQHYSEFMRKFPTLVSLSLAPEAEVLATWSGLGYYRRARMLHKAAQFITRELGGALPTDAARLKTLPGIGDYTAAAVASIAFGESIAVVDGNVERVLLRVLERPHAATAAGKAFVQAQAQALVPRKRLEDGLNAAGDHNQAMMELGATVCLPKGPKCGGCPLYLLCRTRGEHATPARAALRSVPAAHLLSLRKRGTITEVLLHRRSAKESLMPGMLELPSLPQEAVQGREPLLRLRHSITNTNYYVQVFTARGLKDKKMRRALLEKEESLEWVRASRLPLQPLTGLARKVLQRLAVMNVQKVRIEGVESISIPFEEIDVGSDLEAELDYKVEDPV